VAFNAGMDYFVRKQYERAMNSFDKAIKLKPSSAPANYWKGRALVYFWDPSTHQKSRPEMAKRLFERAIELDPSYALAYINLAVEYDAQKDYDRALKFAQKAIDLGPKIGRAYTEYGAILDRNGSNIAQAAQYYRKSIAVDPKYEVAYTNLASALSRLNRKEEAKAILLQCIKISPNYGRAYVRLGTMFEDENKSEAIRLYKKAITVEPGYSDSYYRLGRLYVSEEDYSKAEPILLKGAKVDPYYPAIAVELGMAYEGMDQASAAERWFRKSVDIDPSYMFGYYRLGRTLRLASRLDEAIGIERRAIEIDPKYAYAYLELGLALVAQSRKDEAEVAFRNAVGADPKFSYCWDQLGQLLEAKNDLTGAEKAYAKAVEFSSSTQYSDHLDAVRKLIAGEHPAAAPKPEDEYVIFKKVVSESDSSDDGVYKKKFHVDSFDAGVLAYGLTYQIEGATGTTAFRVKVDDIDAGSVAVEAHNGATPTYWLVFAMGEGSTIAFSRGDGATGTLTKADIVFPTKESAEAARKALIGMIHR
jgi:superkiller protein 3